MNQEASFPSATTPRSVSGASSFDIILERCHDLVSKRVSDALTKMFDEADEALTAFGSLSRDPETSKVYELTRSRVKSQRESIVTQFRMRFLREFQERVNRVKKIGDKFTEVDLSSLGPLADDDPDESLKFDAMASRLLQYCNEELLALDQRVGVLVGDADLQPEDNPFTPQAIVDAYKHTCRQMDSNVEVRIVLLKLFDDYVLDEIRGVYKSVNALLIKNSILPKIRFSVDRGKHGVKSSSGEPSPVEQQSGKMRGRRATDNLPQERPNTRPGRDSNQIDSMTLDIMAMLFDDLFDDPEIPTIVKGLIGRLQTPMLKLVIADRSFFSRKSHPARQMFDKLSELSTDLPADIHKADPLYGKLESIIQSLVEGFEDDVGIFERVRQQLDTLIDELNQRTMDETQPIDKPVDQEEKRALAESVAQAEIEARLHGSAAPHSIVEFLEQHWIRLLVATHVNEGEESEAWRDALRTVDMLLWSGERKETIEERSKMVAALPKLLKSLADGLAYAGIDDTIRVQFFSDLRKLHAALIGRSAHPGVEATGTSRTVADTEAAASIAEPGEAEPGDTAEQTDGFPMQGKPDEADTRQALPLDYLPAGDKAVGSAGLEYLATANTVTPGEKSPTTDSRSATPEKQALQEAVPEKPAIEDAASVDIESLMNAMPSLEFEAEAEKPGKQGAAPGDAASGVQSRRPELTESTTRTYQEPSAQLRAEMDKAMDATRTMFSDVDRFIMLGQTQNAINVLDSRIKREPSDRDSWIKMMAICRDAGMEDDFYRTYAAFRNQFGDRPGS